MSGLLLARPEEAAARGGQGVPQRVALHAQLAFSWTLFPLPTSVGTASLIVALGPGLPTVMAGRLLYGAGIGFAMHAAPAYIAGEHGGCG